MNESIKNAIESAYLTFNKYKVENFKNVSCFDFGPSEEELDGLMKGLRNIPSETLDGMEFFDEGWESWGTEQEVKYFLPRILEYLAEEIDQFFLSRSF